MLFIEFTEKVVLIENGKEIIVDSLEIDYMEDRIYSLKKNDYIYEVCFLERCSRYEEIKYT